MGVIKYIFFGENKNSPKWELGQGKKWLRIFRDILCAKTTFLCGGKNRILCGNIVIPTLYSKQAPTSQFLQSQKKTAQWESIRKAFVVFVTFL